MTAKDVLNWKHRSPNIELVEQVPRHDLPSGRDQRENTDRQSGLLEGNTPIHKHGDNMGKYGRHAAGSERDGRHQDPERTGGDSLPQAEPRQRRGRSRLRPCFLCAPHDFLYPARRIS